MPRSPNFKKRIPFIGTIPDLGKIYAENNERTKMEETYYTTFQDETAKGEKARGAHYLALLAVYNLGVSAGEDKAELWTRSFVRRRIADFLERAAKRVRKWA